MRSICQGLQGHYWAVYLKGGKIKIELGLGRGKQHYDKRAAVRERDANREAEAAMRRKR